MSTLSPLSKIYDFSTIEKRWTIFWEENNLSSPVEEGKPYCIVIPPPNVTGFLHMGHALTNTLQDVLIRWKRMSGERVLWVPGVDHAGIATQTAVEKNLLSKEGKRRLDYTKEEFLALVWTWKEEKEQVIISQLKQMGCSCAWSHYRFTLDEGCNRAVKQVFKRLLDDGLIYRGDYLVNWDPITQTALSDDEVEYEEKQSSLWHFRYPLQDGSDFVVIATTRPETMLGDSAVAIAPGDERYRHLIGKQVLLPLVNRSIPVIEDNHVDPQFGTGVVKITPAHDPNDYEIGQRHALASFNIMTPQGQIVDEYDEFKGMTMLQARKAVVDKMTELGLVEKIEPHTHRVGFSYRSKAIVEPYLSKQWFVHMSPFKQRMREVVEKSDIQLLPEWWKNTYFHWIDHLRDWCISRQLWWGHRIPVWYHKENPDRIVCDGGEGTPREVLDNPQEWIEENDVLDTWFSSALWPFSALGWPSHSNEWKAFYPNSTLITGHDILFFWVARMIMMGLYVHDRVPFQQVFLHGLIYGKSYWTTDDKGQVHYITGKEQIAYEMGTKEPPKEVQHRWEKMSKSKGNVIDPLEMIREYGMDAVRMALCSRANQAAQIDLDRRSFASCKHFTNKIWNGARFILAHLQGDEEQSLEPLTLEMLQRGIDREKLLLEDYWILSQLNRLIVSMNDALSRYAFDQATQEGYEFFWKKLCSYYLEISKPVLFGKAKGKEEKENKKRILFVLLASVIRLLHPMAPGITEEIFQRLKTLYSFSGQIGEIYVQESCNALQSKACMVSAYPCQPLVPNDVNEKKEKQFDAMSQIVYTIRNMRGEMQLPLSFPVDVYFSATSLKGEQLLKEIENNAYYLHALVKIQKIHCNSTIGNTAFGSSQHVDGLTLFIPLPLDFYEKEQQRLIKEEKQLEQQIEKLNQQLSSPHFTARAPQQLVEKTREQKTALDAQLEQTKASLQQLQENSHNVK